MAINNNNYSGQMNWGDWQQMPDYRQFGPARNSSPVASLGRMLDPMTYIPGLNWLPNKVHDAAEYAAQKGNQALEPVFKALGTVGENTDPFQMTLKKAMPERHAGVRDWITEHPVDTMALIAGTFFGGAALGGAAGAGGGGAAATAAPAASTAGGAGGLGSAGAAGSAAITPAFASGTIAPATAGGAGLVGASSISPALASGAYAGGAGAAGTGTLGAAGTKAAISAISPTFQSGLVGGSGGGLLSNAEKALGYVKQANNYRSNIESFVDAGKQGRTRANDNIGERMLNEYRQETSPTKRLARSITMQRFRR